MAQQISTKTGMTFTEIRNEANGLHFAKESLTDRERQMLTLLEGTLDILDDLTTDGNFRGYAEELGEYTPEKTSTHEV